MAYQFRNSKIMETYKQPNYSRLSPCVTLSDVQKSIDFYTKAFGFEILEKHEHEGAVNGATLKLGDVSFMIFCKSLGAGGKTLSSEQTETSSGSSIYAYCPNVDDLYKNAISYGATSLSEPQDSFWGDRFCQIRDLDGYEWGFATYQQPVNQLG